MPCCYIIFSPKVNKFYIGASHLDFSLRLFSHNSHKYGKKHFTSIADDWQVYLIIEVENFVQALRIERKIKSMKSKIFIQNLKKYPELIDKIKISTS